MFARRHRSEVSQKSSRTLPLSSLEGLEGRVLMSTTVVTQPAFKDFATPNGLRFNGYGDSATTSKRALQLTDGGNYESRSAFWTQKVPVDTFSTTFSFASTAANVSADGFTFIVQGYGTNAHGHSGANLGLLSTSFNKSVAVAFNLYNSGGYQSKFGFAKGGGTAPVTETPMGNIDLHNGDIFTATVTYDGTNLNVRVNDTANPSAVFKASEVVNIPSLVGGSTAFVGFTGSTGVQTSTQKITAWNYTGSNAGPTIKKHAAATPASTTVAKGTTLSVVGAGAGGASALTYTWAAITVPSSKAKVAFAKNGTNAASSTKVTFKSVGRYVFQCTIKDKFGFTVGSNSVVVTAK